MKRLTALLLSVLMILSAQTVLGLELTGQVKDGIPNLVTLTKDNCTALGTSSQSVNSGQRIVENDKYLFAVIGMQSYNYTVCSVVQIYDKATGGLLKTITQKSGNATWYCPVRDIYVANDILYISWGNAVNNVNNIAQRANGSVQSPLYAYDVSNVTSDGELKQVTIDTGNVHQQAQLPYTWGGISYLDSQNGKIYSSKVTDKGYSKRYYTVTDTASVKNVMNEVADASLAKQYFYTTALSMNAVKFMVKDGWLYEVLHQNAGLTGITDYDTLVDAEGKEINNTVYAYDLTGVQLTGETQDITSCLRGVYTTDTTGDNAIRDIEVIGNTLYVSTSAGVEVVDLSAAKAEGVTETQTLTAAKTLTGIGGARDLEAIGLYLYAAFEGPQAFYSPNSTSEAGSVVIYNTIDTPLNPQVALSQSVAYGALDMSLNTSEEIIYVMNDTKGPPSMAAYGYSLEAPSFESNFAFESKVTENIPSLSTFDKNDDALSATSWSANKGQMIAENDKYIFVVSAKSNLTTCAVVQIYDKASGELLATLSEKADVTNHYRMVRSMYASGDVLYITWGNSWNEGQEHASTVGSTMSPTRVYDVSNVAEGTAPTGLTIHTGGQRTSAAAPFMLGNLSYLDEENGKFYISCVVNGTYSYKQYYVYNVSDIKTALEAGSTSVSASETFTTGKLSKNAVKFIVKDGWLYELLQSKAGFSQYDGGTVAETLVDSEGNAINNMVRVYNLRASAEADRESCLRGTYVTQTAGAKAIKDIEVIGDYLYAAIQTYETTTNESEETVTTIKGGVEIVPLGGAKASGVTAETAAELNGVKTLAGNGGVLDLDSMDSVLFASFTGPELYMSPNSTSQAGELVAYDTSANGADPAVIERQEISYGVADIAINEDSKVIYVLNDTMGPPSMAAYSFVTPEIQFVSASGTSYDLAAGTYDINVKVSNADLASGTLVCALYEGNKLSDILLKNYYQSGNVTVAEDYEISEDITKIKVMYISGTGNVSPLCSAVSAEK